MKNYREKLSKITTFIFDFDGVLSDGMVWALPSGEQLRATHVRDGYAMQYALRKGYRVAIISGGWGEAMTSRYDYFEGLEIYLKVSDKVVKFNEYTAQHGINPEEVLFMGDDIPDTELMKLVGVKTCPANACEEVKRLVDYISHQNGGHGAVRDVVEQVLKAQERWMEADAHIW